MSAQPGPLSRDEAIAIARQMAVVQGFGYSAPSYLPRNSVQAETFEPHAWVIAAIQFAHDAALAKVSS